ncbi:uncharacterized protein A4U43_C05F13110 [Asparagus officinalis]|uniref:Uncharacterized protein n=1 Tax=Asparagus officinalis TaxID=4686 RepID=A0A5P1ERB1_ASPOF|nr:uncharacterized protein A4U43_C05F13110 [Asparagus officinalis]
MDFSRTTNAETSSPTANSSDHNMHLHLCGCGISSLPSKFNQSSSRFHLLGDRSRDDGEDDSNKETATRVQRRWRDAFKRLVKECRGSSCRRTKKIGNYCSCYSSRPSNTFGYDVASYLKNFDDGLLNDNDDHFVPLAIRAPPAETNLKAAY